MNRTNRAVNRLVLFILGAVLAAIGGLLILTASIPQVSDTWAGIGGDTERWISSAWDATAIAGTQLAWIALALVAALVLLVVLLTILVARTIRGRRRTALQATAGENEAGRIVVTEGFAASAVKQAVDAHDEVLSSRVTASEVAGDPVLHVAITPRQNTSPRQIATMTDELVENLATLTGQQLDTFISIHTSIRARLARDERRVH
jgi:Na+/H+-translocating membrane pyrophosphatase